MAQNYPRKTLAVFGIGGTTDDFEQFGSTAVAATDYTKDIETIQGLAAWNTGWRAALVASKAPILQDMNAVWLVHSYMQGSLFEEGIPEWDAGTTYAWGSVVKLPYTGGNNFQLFISLGDANLNNALPTAPASNTAWQFVMGIVAGVLVFGQKIGFGNNNTQGLVGTATNDEPPAGCVGEVVSSFLASQNITPTASWTNITSISLTAGDWDVSGMVDFAMNGSTMTVCLMAVSVDGGTGSNPSDYVLGDTGMGCITPTNVCDTSASVPLWRVKLATTTTLYLKARCSFSAGTPTASGRITARRRR